MTIMMSAAKGDRLPDKVEPTHYDLSIKTDLESQAFEGSVTIRLNVKEETSLFVLHSLGLTLHAAAICTHPSEKNPEWQDADIIFIPEKERAAFQITSPLRAPSEALLRITFSGILSDSMIGYFRASYEEEGKTKYYAVTHFEPTGARRAFPCWDEPLLKATYSVTMISRVGTVNLSNMPVVSEEAFGDGSESSEWKITTFEKTPLVSSYLIALANGTFTYAESSFCSPLSGKVKPMRFYATKDDIDKVQFALDLSTKVVPKYEEIFDIEYALPKLDTLVITKFTGAMENWGLIIGQKNDYLISKGDEQTALDSKKALIDTICHEIAHQWFGNITTMAWWDNLYLNEGFATLMSVLMAGVLFPELNLGSEFISLQWNRGLQLDAQPTTHPIEVDIPDGASPNEIFDALTYAKAASVLRMLSDTIGDDLFLKGVSNYLKKHLYGNTVTKDLWDGIGEVTGTDVASFMTNWITKPGFPLITVVENDNSISVTQERFFETGTSDGSDTDTIWQVPLNIVSVPSKGRKKIDSEIYLRERSAEVAFDPSLAFKMNFDGIGFYRVLYTPERLSKIAGYSVRDSAFLSVKDRISMIHDAFALGKAGYAKLSSSLDLIMTWCQDREFAVWKAIQNELNLLVRIWQHDEDVNALLASFCRQLYGPLKKRLGMHEKPGESIEDTQLRSLALSALAKADDEAVVSEFVRRFVEYRKTGDKSLISADLQTAIFAVAVKHGKTDDDYEYMVSLYKKSETPGIHLAAIAAMCLTQNSGQISRTFDFILDGGFNEDVPHFFLWLSGNPAASLRLTEFMMHNYEKLYQRFEGSFALGTIIKNSIDHLTTEKDAQKVEEFFKDKEHAKLDRTLQVSLNTIRSNVQLIERSTNDIKEWLKHSEVSNYTTTGSKDSDLTLLERICTIA